MQNCKQTSYKWLLQFILLTLRHSRLCEGSESQSTIFSDKTTAFKHTMYFFKIRRIGKTLLLHCFPKKHVTTFLLLARDVPNVAKRSIWDQWKYILTTDRPATSDRPLISKISNGHISATGRPIHSMFGSRVGFSGTADLMVLFPVRKNPIWRPPSSWKNFKWPYLRNRSSDPLYVWF